MEERPFMQIEEADVNRRLSTQESMVKNVTFVESVAKELSS
ncbi:MAG: hypothetical protein ACYC3X_28565 [Pirellulaceae bacterium]